MSAVRPSIAHIVYVLSERLVILNEASVHVLIGFKEVARIIPQLQMMLVVAVELVRDGVEHTTAICGSIDRVQP